jgi:hypothetical protein
MEADRDLLVDLDQLARWRDTLRAFPALHVDAGTLAQGRGTAAVGDQLPGVKHLDERDAEATAIAQRLAAWVDREIVSLADGVHGCIADYASAQDEVRALFGAIETGR